MPSGHGKQPNTVALITNEFTKAAKQLHAQNAERILGEFAWCEATDGDVLGCLGHAEKDEGGRQHRITRKEIENRRVLAKFTRHMRAEALTHSL